MIKKTSAKKAAAMSVISLALCFVMLLGTTFAWFTASTSTIVNTLTSGNLKIDLVDADEASLVGKTVPFADGEVLWVPNCEYAVEDIFLKNTGTCDIKYKINVIGISGDEGLASVIEWKVNGTDAAAFTGTLASGALSDPIQLSGSMKKTAGNRYMDKTADGVAIAVYATQIDDEAELEEVVALIRELDEVPTVTAIKGYGTDNEEEVTVTLDTAYTFTPVPGAPEAKYANWNADYVVSVNKDLEPGDICLAGQYDWWSEDWVAYYNPVAVAAGEEVRLLKDSRNIYVTYDECCNVVKEFNCGAASNVEGLVAHIELRLYERDARGVETGEYVTAATYTYAF